VAPQWARRLLGGGPRPWPRAVRGTRLDLEEHAFTREFGLRRGSLDGVRAVLITLLRVLAAGAIALTVLVTSITAVGLVWLALGRAALTQGSSIGRLLGVWVIVAGALLCVSRLAHLGACALRARGRDHPPPTGD